MRARALIILGASAIFAIASPSHAQAKASNSTITIQGPPITAKNVKSVRKGVLRQCPSGLKKQAQKDSKETRDAIVQARASEQDYIDKNKCVVPKDRPIPPESEILGERFIRIFVVPGTGPANCGDAIFAKDMLNQYWPLLSVQRLADSCGLVQPASKKTDPKLEARPVVADPSDDQAKLNDSSPFSGVAGE
jgi:hypothetical protein